MEHYKRLQNRRLPRVIPADDQIRPPQVFKADVLQSAEVLQLKGGQHARSLTNPVASVKGECRQRFLDYAYSAFTVSRLTPRISKIRKIVSSIRLFGQEAPAVMPMTTGFSPSSTEG